MKAKTAIGDGGQSVVELALVLPVIMVALLALVQVGLLLHQKILVVHAAREAARAVAVDDDPAAGRKAALDATAFRESDLSVQVGPRGEVGALVDVVVTYEAQTDVPLVGALVGDVQLAAAASMRVED